VDPKAGLDVMAEIKKKILPEIERWSPSKLLRIKTTG
jgi:hypothetical protein